MSQEERIAYLRQVGARYASEQAVRKDLQGFLALLAPLVPTKKSAVSD